MIPFDEEQNDDSGEFDQINSGCMVWTIEMGEFPGA